MRNLNLIIFIVLLGCTVLSSMSIAITSNSSMNSNASMTTNSAMILNSSNSLIESTSKLSSLVSKMDSYYSYFVFIIFIAPVLQLIFYINSGKEPLKVYTYLIICICYFSISVKDILYESIQMLLDYLNISVPPCFVISIMLTVAHFTACIVIITYDCLKRQEKKDAWAKVSTDQLTKCNVNVQVSKTKYQSPSKVTYQCNLKIADAKSVLACLEKNINHDAPPSYEQYKK